MAQEVHGGLKMVGVCMVMLALHLTVSAQQVRVVDATDSIPVPHAHLELEDGGRILGDADGVLSLDGTSLISMVKVSALGYHSVTVHGKELIEDDTIYLLPASLQLSEVVVRAKPPTAIIQKAMKAIDQNYRADSFATAHYYREQLLESGTLIHQVEAFIEAKQPGYNVPKDSFEVYVLAGRTASDEALRFMQKEREKGMEKAYKKARRDDPDVTRESFDFPLELGSPALLLNSDPVRHKDVTMSINDDNIDFLDSANFDRYQYWYGTPVMLDQRSLIVIHFEPKPGIKKPLCEGSIWIDPTSLAFVKLSFGLGKEGQNHLLPLSMRAALWVYGLDYELKNTSIELEYRPFESTWHLVTTRLQLTVDLEKRRFFTSNDKGLFEFDCEMITLRTQRIDEASIKGVPFDYKRSLSEQFPECTDEEWKARMAKRRQYH